MNSLLTDRTVGDPDRLAALEALGVLDTPAEADFDDVVRLATRLCAVPVALVSLVSADRQWFKARIGFPTSETDLDRSVCRIALSADDLLVIPDLTADPRTAANPLVTGEPHIRFYAGAPLRLGSGLVVGSLCIVDTVPRPGGLTPDQAEDLRALARQVVAQLELRGALHGRAASAGIRVVVVDLDVRGSVMGLELATLIRHRWPPIELILTGAMRPDRSRIPARGVFHDKPFDQGQIVQSIRFFAAETQ